MRGALVGSVLLAALAAAPAHAICANILFVRNNGPNGSGTTFDDPVNVLPVLPDPSIQVVYLFIGSATTINQQNGIALMGSQKLIGETIGYQDDCHDIPPTISAARPAITSTIGSAVSVLGDNEVAGIRIIDPLVAGILGSFNTGSYIHDNILEEASIQLISASGTHRIEDNEISEPAGVGIAFQHDGSGVDLTISGNTIEDSEEQPIAVSSSAPGNDVMSILNNTLLRPDNEGVELDELNGDIRIEGNAIRDGRSRGLDLDNVAGRVRIHDNEFEDLDDAAVFVETEGSIALDLTITDNEDTDSRSDPLSNFGDSIELVSRDSSTMVALVEGNRVEDAGRDGIDLAALESSDVAARIARNQVYDAGQLGIRADVAGTAFLRAVVERNDVRRSGNSGISSALTSNTLGQELRIFDNDVIDAEDVGIAFQLLGVGPHQIHLRIDDNEVADSLEQGILLTTVGATAGEVTASVSRNLLLGNENLGTRILSASETDIHVHAEENVFSANLGLWGLDATAAGEGGLCTVLANNQSDNGYRLEAANDGIHIYEDLLGTNGGAVALEDNAGQTLGAVAVGSCREVMLGPVPEPMLPVTVPEPGARARALAMLLGIALLARLRTSGRRSLPFCAVR